MTNHRRCVRGLTAVLCACLCASVAAAQVRSKVPVLIGGEDASEGCAGTAVVAVRGTLNLRSGPGTTHPAIARLTPGQTVSVCQRLENGWVGVVIHRDRSVAADCGLSDAGPAQTPYAGPCGSGWVSERYLRLLAG